MTYADLPANLQAAYSWLDAKSKEYPLVMDKHNVLRFKGNPFVEYYVSWFYNEGDMKLGPNLNDAHTRSGGFTLEERMDFYRQMGYSLSGFGDVFADFFDAQEEQCSSSETDAGSLER